MSKEYRKSTDIVVAISGIIFFGAIVVASGFYFYERYLTQQIDELSSTLSHVEGEFEAPLVEELVRISKSIDSLKLMLASHKSPSRVFDFLEQNTIPEVAFKSFSFIDGDAAVSMDAIAKSYTALSQQSMVFGESSLLKESKISGISLQDSGEINFKVRLIFNPSLLQYRP